MFIVCGKSGYIVMSLLKMDLSRIAVFGGMIHSPSMMSLSALSVIPSMRATSGRVRRARIRFASILFDVTVEKSRVPLPCEGVCVCVVVMSSEAGEGLCSFALELSWLKSVSRTGRVATHCCVTRV